MTKRRCDALTDRRRPCRATPWEHGVVWVGRRELRLCYHHHLALQLDGIRLSDGTPLEMEDLAVDAYDDAIQAERDGLVSYVVDALVRLTEIDSYDQRFRDAKALIEDAAIDRRAA